MVFKINKVSNKIFLIFKFKILNKKENKKYFKIIINIINKL